MNHPRAECNPFEDGTAAAALRGLPTFEEAVARLLHTVEHGRPFGVVRGPEGAGKTYVLEQVAGDYRRTGHECGQLDLRCSSAEEFASQLADELGCLAMGSQPCWRIVQDCIRGRAHAARPTLLLLDHLDTATAALMPQLERLVAIAETSAGWCTVLCAARTPSRSVDQLALRHAELRIEMGPLTADETADFLHQVVMLSGCPAFTASAATAIYNRTGGLLRDVLQLGRLAQFARRADDAPEVTAELVTMVAGELPSRSSSRLPDRREVTPADDRLLTADI